MTYLKVPHLNRWDVDKFWNNNNFIYRPDTGCLEWQKYLDVNGYGKLQVNGVAIPAHRLAYYIYYRQDPGDLLVRHICDNRICSHPFHLELGTHLDNSRDMVRRGRSQTGDRHWMKRNPELFEQIRASGAFDNSNLPPNGEDHPATKLTADVAHSIKQRSAEGIGNRELAKEFGVTHSNISAIVLGKSWGHIKGETRPKDKRFGVKLTPEKVRDIRSQVANGRAVWNIAKELKMSPTTIKKVVDRETWKHIE